MKRTRKGSLTNIPEHVTRQEPAERRKKLAGRETVSMTIRFSREAWREVHDMAQTEGISVNTLVTEALNQMRKDQGLPPLKPVPSSAVK